jgi:hypothetical protein
VHYSANKSVHPEIDILDWIFYLEMLSVERTAQFLPELNLPFKREYFPKIMRLARGCLELYMFRSIRVPKGHADSPGLIEAWHLYRETEGVLSNELMNELFEKYGRSGIAALTVHSDLQGWVGPDTAKALRRWFENNFPFESYQVWQWPWALERLLVDLPRKISLTRPAPITDRERQSVSDYCSRYRASLDVLEKRFYTLREVEKRIPRTLWESVLQAFPADGPVNDLFWLDTVERCLKLKLIRVEWSNLKAELGSEVVEKLTSWVREQVKLLPGDVELPNEPNWPDVVASGE